MQTQDAWCSFQDLRRFRIDAAAFGDWPALSLRLAGNRINLQSVIKSIRHILMIGAHTKFCKECDAQFLEN